MAWAKFHDGFDDDPEIDRFSGDAIALFVCSVTWSSRSLTDGFIPELRVAKLPGGTPEAVEILCFGEKPWWLKVEGGYQIRSFHKYNPSAEEVRQLRETRSELGRLGAIARWQTDGKWDGKSHSKSIAPYPGSRIPYSVPHNPKNRNSREFQREPEAGKDYVLQCIGDDASAKMFKPGTDELFDAGAWFAERNLTPTRHWEHRV